MSDDEIKNVVDDFFSDDDILQQIDCIRQEEISSQENCFTDIDTFYLSEKGTPLFTAVGVRVENEIMQQFVRHMRPLVARYQLDWDEVKRVFFQKLDILIRR